MYLLPPSCVHTSVHNIVLVQIVNSIKYLSNRLGCVLLCELSALADLVKQLPAGSKLSDDVIFVLCLWLALVSMVKL